MACYLMLHIYFDNKHVKFDLSKFANRSLTFGRDISNDLVIETLSILSNHLEFHIEDTDCYVRDLSGCGFSYKGKKLGDKTLEAGDVLNIGEVIILATRKSKFDEAVSRFDIGGIREIKIGKRDTNHVVIGSRFVSGEHCKIIREQDGNLKLVDLNSKNGVYVNGFKRTECYLNDGDSIEIMGYKITAAKSYLAINNVGNGVTVNNLMPYAEETEQRIDQQTNEEQTTDKEAAVLVKQNKKKAPYPFFQRSPRLMQEIPAGEVEVNGPPYSSQKPHISWFSVLLPPIVMVAVSIIMATMMAGGIYIFFTLSMTGVTVVVSVVNYFSQVKKYKNDEKKRAANYLEYLRKIRDELGAKRDLHRRVLNEKHPNIHSCIQRVESLDRRLWERTPSNEDFLDIRFGKGSEPLRFNVKIPRPEVSIERDPLKDEPEKIAEEFKTVDNIPISVSLIKNGTVGLIGDRDEMLQVARDMIIQIAANHSYDEVKIVCIFPEIESSEWVWVRWLPHLWDDERQLRFLAKDKMTAHNIFTSLYDLIKTRENIRRSDTTQRESMQLPHIVFFLADTALVQNEPVMNYLATNNQFLGISSVFLFNRMELLPKECSTIIQVQTRESLLYQRYNANIKVAFTSDYIERADAEYFARKMAPIRLKDLASSMTIPNRVPFLDIFGVTAVGQLQVMERWEKAKPHKSLAAPIGKSSGSGDLLLDIHERAHGPHGLVAGTVGSGKSELLQSLILSLAVNYHPHDVTFVLIDYKGGGMANSFAGLPHVIGNITNLSANEISRALVSIKSELKRRQTILANYNVNSINDYIRLYKESRAEEPLPHLIIVVDEFAELKADQPEFMRELVSAARLGRSLGIHLILATQKPSGVVDEQIWSNSRFRLCLKVQEAADSREVLKRPDAANIKVTGRCFIQVGNDELFEQFQSAWSGAEYGTDLENSAAGEVYLVNLDGSRNNTSCSNDTTLFSEKKLTQLKAVVEHIADTAVKNHISPLAGPWLPPLPEQLSLSDLKDSKEGRDGEKWPPVQTWLSPVVGLVDDPSNQLQYPFDVNLGRDGHLAIYGAPGTGKTVLAQTIITSIILSHTPNEVNIYVLDFGGRTMGLFSDLPHLGGIVFAEEEEKLSKLLKMLMRELELRKYSFSDIGVSNLPAYRKVNGDTVPAIVMVIDNYSAMTELYPETEELLVPLSREGGNYGIHLVLTANSTNAIRFKVSQNIKAAVALQMADRSDYTGIVGRTDGLEPADLPGRGLIKTNPPLEFQAALPIAAESDAMMAVEMKKLFKAVAGKWQGRKAKPIPVMPQVLLLSELLENDGVKELAGGRPTLLPLGLDTEDVQPVCFDLIDSHCFLVSGQLSSGKSSFLKTVAALCQRKLPFASTELYIVDSPQMDLAALANTSFINEYITESGQFAEFMERLVIELNERKKDLNEAKRVSQGKLGDADYIFNKYAGIILLIDDLSEFIKMIDDESKNSFERVVRFGKGLGIFLFISGCTDDIIKLYQIDSLTKAAVDMQTGLALGGTFDQHNFFAVNMPYQEKSRPLNFGEAYFINKGRYKKTKVAVDK